MTELKIKQFRNLKPRVHLSKNHMFPLSQDEPLNHPLVLLLPPQNKVVAQTQMAIDRSHCL